jgi:hypothetical protein
VSSARVHRLRLTAAHDDDVRSGAILLGDALRVATLPQARAARHYVVRHLDVGRFARDAAPQTVALAIERRLAELTPLAVPATSPSAVTAPAVYFDDEATAIALLAERVVAGPPPTEWFWRQIGRGALRAPDAHSILSACLAAAAYLDAAPRAVALLVDRVERARPGAILDALTTSHAHALLVQTFRLAAPPSPERAAIAAMIPLFARLTPAWRARLAIAARVWGADIRALLVAALALVDSGVAPPSPDRLLALAHELIVTLAMPGLSLDSLTPSPSSASDPRRPSSDAPPPAPVPRAPSSGPPGFRPSPSPDVVASSSAIAPSPSFTSPSPDAAPSSGPSHIPSPDGDTTVGGLLFLLRPLAHLDLPGWIDRHAWAASTSFGARLLAGIALDHGATPDDPLVVALTADLAPFLDDRPLVRAAWTRRLARFLRAHTDLTIADIVGRPARLAATRTHLDLLFHLRDADIRVRLAALDADPGWVPWLGRVVRFHYVDGARA